MLLYKPLVKMKSLKEWERDIILRTLQTLDWNKTQTALVLDIAPHTLRDKIKIYRSEGFEVPQFARPVKSLP